MRHIAIFALALGVMSCSEPEVSQILVRIEADPGVVAMTQSLTVFVDGGPNSDVLTRVQTITLGGNSYPREIALAPRNDDPTRYYRVVARAQRTPVADPTDTTFAQAALLGTYIRGETRVVVLRIEDSCIDVPCGETQHCTGAACVPPPDVTPSPLDGGLMDMSMSDLGPSTSCTTDGDCDDDIGCTVDSCTLGRCVNATDDSACPAPSNQCLRSVCVAGSGCAEEPRSGSCDNGQYCDGNDSCVGGVCTGAGDPCMGMTECDEDLDACTGCAGSEDCTNGRVCTGGTCTCPTGSVEMCGVDGDEDCNGLADCADPECDRVSCDTNGFVCIIEDRSCDCPRSGPETLCGNGVDDDCDGSMDCMDEDCDGASCMSGRICIARSCQEPPLDGGVMEPDLGVPDFGTDLGGAMPLDLGGPDFGMDSGGPTIVDMSMSVPVDM